MCEILVCVKDRSTTGNPVIDSPCPKQGDVIFAAPDGWGWGGHELGTTLCSVNGNHPFFRIVKLPNVTLAQIAKMLSAELPVDMQHPSPYLQYRGFFFDKTKIPVGALATHWTDDTRKSPFISLPLTMTQINAFISQRTPVPFA